jgi:hypothetical protein
MRRLCVLLSAGLACTCGLAIAEPKVQVTASVPRQDISLTIYNPAVTLVQERRALSLGAGLNEFRVSWGGVNLNRDSVRLDLVEGAQEVAIRDAVYVASDPNTVVWHLEAKRVGSYPASISYLASGLWWRADHVVTVDDEEKMLALKTWATIANESGEDYQEARIRLAMGDLRLLSEPREPAGPAGAPAARRALGMIGGLGGGGVDAAFAREGFSEYTFYTLGRRESLDSGDTKRIELASKSGVPIRKMHIYDERMYEGNVAMQYWFDNKKEYDLGPLPPGLVRAYRQEKEAMLTLLGEDSLAYVPVGETVKLYLGNARNIIVEPKQTAYARSEEQYSKEGTLVSYVETAEYTVTIKNRRAEPIEMTLRQYLPTADTVLVDSSPKAESPSVATLEWKLKIGAEKEEKVIYHTRRKVTAEPER